MVDGLGQSTPLYNWPDSVGQFLSFYSEISRVVDRGICLS